MLFLKKSLLYQYHLHQYIFVLIGNNNERCLLSIYYQDQFYLAPQDFLKLFPIATCIHILLLTFLGKILAAHLLSLIFQIRFQLYHKYLRRSNFPLIREVFDNNIPHQGQVYLEYFHGA